MFPSLLLYLGIKYYINYLLIYNKNLLLKPPLGLRKNGLLLFSCKIKKKSMKWEFQMVVFKWGLLYVLSYFVCICVINPSKSVAHEEYNAIPYISLVTTNVCEFIGSAERL